MSRRPYSYLARFALSLSALIILGFAALVVWVTTGPRSLGVLTPYIESAMTYPGSGYSVKIGTPMLIWDGWTHPVGVHLQNMDVLDDKGTIVAHFPEVGVRMYFLELLRGEVNIKTIELLNPVATLVEDEQGNLTSFGFSGENTEGGTSLPAALGLLSSEKGDNPVTHLKSFIIRHASLSVKDFLGNTFLSSPDASMEIKRDKTHAEGRFVMPLDFAGKQSQIDIRFSLNGSDRIATSDIVFSEVPSSILHAFAPSQTWMGGIHMPLSGHAFMKSDFNANIEAIDFSLDAGQGSIEFPEQFEHVLKPKHIRVEGSLTDKLTTFKITDGVLDFGRQALNFKGTVHKEGQDYGMDMYAETENAPMDSIHDYWPLKLSPHSRKWVVTHMSKGTIIKADVSLHFKPGEMKLKDTPEAAVDSTITLKGATINYKPDHPSVTNADGTVKFTGKSMDARISHADYLESTHINSGRVRFPNFYPDDVRLFIDMDFDTNARDIRRFLSLPDLNKSSKLGLTEDIVGEATGNAKLDFIAFSENGKDDVGETGRLNYDVDASLKNVTQKHFMNKYDVAEAFMKLVVDNKNLKLSGKSNINGVPMNIGLTSSFARDTETKYDIKASMPVARLKDFGLPNMDFAKGTMGVNAVFSASDKEDKADATVDLKDVAIDLPAQGLSKASGQNALLHLYATKTPTGGMLIDNFTLTGDGIDMAGSAEYDETTDAFSRFSLKPAKWNGLDLEQLVYGKNGNNIDLAATGNLFDASPYLKTSGSKNTDINYTMNLRLNRLILGAGRALDDVTIKADCPADACRFAHIRAKLEDETPFQFDISGGKLDASCGNAGELVHTLGLLDTIQGGKMILRGSYDASILSGELEVRDYALKNAPVVTKIFTIASLSGILNTVTGSGIYFDRLSAPFVFHRGNLILKDAKAHGSALGLTAAGTVNIDQQTFDLSGLLVPSYTLNSLIGNLPLIGDLLMGGSGKGLVALSYRIHGSINDPSVHMNPLSVLTLGFLRDIFNIFDKPPPDIAAIEAAQKKAVAQTPVATPAVPTTAPTNPLPSLNEIQ